MRRGLLLALALACPAARAQSPSSPTAAAFPPIAFETFSLPNGLRVILAVDRAAPVATAAWMFPVGGRQEDKGRSGFAHLFEHLMFEGSAHVPKGQFDRILEAAGGDNNAFTHRDFTFFYEKVPANALPLALWLDADRWREPAIDKAGLRNQIDVVKEEKRMSVDNQAYAPLLEVEIASRAFSQWANAHPLIGSFADLDAATLPDVQEFFRRHYDLAQGWLAVAGDFDPAAVRALLGPYLDRPLNIRPFIAQRAFRTPPAPAAGPEPVQQKQRIFSVSDPQAKAPGVAVVWTGAPPRRSPDFYALALLGKLLFEGRSSRLYQRLVKESQVATSIDEGGAGGLGFPVSDWEGYKEPGLFGGFIVHKSSVSARQVAGLVFDEADRIAAGGVAEADLARVKAKFRSDWIMERQTGLGRAQALLRAAVLDGDPAAANGELERYLAVGAAELQAAAGRYLAAERANIFELKTGAP